MAAANYRFIFPRIICPYHPDLLDATVYLRTDTSQFQHLLRHGSKVCLGR